jgi:hypothetical protein
VFFRRVDPSTGRFLVARSGRTAPEDSAVDLTTEGTADVSEVHAGSSVRLAELSLTIAVLTFRRPDDIAAVLPLLAEQARTVADRVARVRVLVVDNDAAESAREVVTKIADTFEDADVVYVAEHRPGITAARNRALEDSAESDLLIFIDDDERPSEGWLATHLAALAAYGAAAVVGPVISRFPAEPDPWIIAGEFFVRRRMPTGSRIDVAATNNLLIDLRVVRAMRLRFDEAFGFAGGEDTMFTRALAQKALMIWADEAIVFDIVPSDRMTRRWVVQRAFSSGNSWSLTSIALADKGAPRLAARTRAAAIGSARVVVGAARSGFGLASRNVRHSAKGRRTLARGLGMVSGSIGHAYEEYARDESEDTIALGRSDASVG